MFCRIKSYDHFKMFCFISSNYLKIPLPIFCRPNYSHKLKLLGTIFFKARFNLTFHRIYRVAQVFPPVYNILINFFFIQQLTFNKYIVCVEDYIKSSRLLFVQLGFDLITIIKMITIFRKKQDLIEATFFTTQLNFLIFQSVNVY